METILAIDCSKRKHNNANGINYYRPMDKARKTLLRNIDRLMKEKAWRPKDLEKKSGLSQRTVSNILNPEVEVNPTATTIAKLAKAFSLTSSSLLADDLAVDYINRGIGNSEGGPSIRGRVPLISWVLAGTWGETFDHNAPGVAEDWIITTVNVGPSAFAVRVRGDSMEPEFSDGDIVVCDPSSQPVSGKFVIVRLEEAHEATFKQLIEDGGQRYLKPLNPRYPIIQVNSNATFCGVVVSKTKIY